MAQSLVRPDSSAEVRPARLVDVPYVAQSADLCGGAALAMVRRYWGDTQVIAEDFASLVDPREGGIRTSTLTEAARSGDWTALAFTGASAEDGMNMIGSHLSRGRPIIALLLDRPGVFHYVVVVAATATTVVLHDPARRPFETLTAEAFDTKWAPAGRWMLLVVPAGASSAQPSGVAPAVPAVSVPTKATPGPIDRAVESASAGRLDAAEATLVEAARTNPDDARVWRELAGIRFLERQWARAEELAVRSAMLDGSDHATWRLVGASRYMLGDRVGALDAFNRAGEPAIDRVLVEGSVMTPDPVVIASTGLQPGRLLTGADFARATRRLGALPIASQSALRFEPAAEGTMTVHASIVERPLLPSGWLNWTVVGARAALTKTLVVEVAGPARSGEVWRGEWRWADGWRRVAFALSTPAPGGAPGVVTLGGRWEEQAFDTGLQTPVTETRRRVEVGLSDWASEHLRWGTAVAFDRFDEAAYVAVSGSVDRRWFDDRASLGIALEQWIGRRQPFGRATAALALRSSAEPVPALSARAGVGFVTTGTPLAVWPTAGVGSDHLATLRAHPRLRDASVPETMMGRRLLFGSFELARPLASVGTGQVWWASFVDAARIADRQSGAGAVTHVDIGIGLRVRVPGVDGTIALNAAYGIRDAGLRFSAVVGRAWPH